MRAAEAGAGEGVGVCEAAAWEVREAAAGGGGCGLVCRLAGSLSRGATWREAVEAARRLLAGAEGARRGAGSVPALVDDVYMLVYGGRAGWLEPALRAVTAGKLICLTARSREDRLAGAAVMLAAAALARLGLAGEAERLADEAVAALSRLLEASGAGP